MPVAGMENPLMLRQFLLFTAWVVATDAAPAQGAPDSTLKESTVRAVFRLIVGQPQIDDREIGLSAGFADAAKHDYSCVWTCTWQNAGGEVVVVQIRDSDGAYRQPKFSELSSLEFGIRLDLRERIAALIEKGRKKKKE